MNTCVFCTWKSLVPFPQLHQTILNHPFGASDTMKREGSNNNCPSSSLPYASMDTHNREGVLAMGNLLLNSLAVRHSSALHDLKQEHPDQADLLVGKRNIGETVTAQKQATGTKQKSTEQNAHYLLTIIIRRELGVITFFRTIFPAKTRLLTREPEKMGRVFCRQKAYSPLERRPRARARATAWVRLATSSLLRI
jgi:hypothetical protein